MLIDSCGVGQEVAEIIDALQRDLGAFGMPELAQALGSEGISELRTSARALKIGKEDFTAAFCTTYSWALGWSDPGEGK